MWTASGTMSSCTTYTLLYKIDMMGGQSGSPIYIYKSGSGYVVYGINSSESTNYNYARRITKELFDWLMSNGYIH